MVILKSKQITAPHALACNQELSQQIGIPKTQRFAHKRKKGGKQMKKQTPTLLIGGLLAAFVALATPLQATAYTAKGITNSTGLAYDDVYGVVNDRAIMKTNSGSIDLVDSTGAIKRATKNGTGWYINDAPEWFNPLESALSTINNGYITLSSTNTENGFFACGLASGYRQRPSYP